MPGPLALPLPRRGAPTLVSLALDDLANSTASALALVKDLATVAFALAKALQESHLHSMGVDGWMKVGLQFGGETATPFRFQFEPKWLRRLFGK
jgi:hypothetical protein